MSETIRVLNEVAQKWQKEWAEKRVFEADPDNNRPKYFITAAFPYPNSPSHIGNARTYVTADVMARYYRMRGYNTLYPMGFHFTGTPIITMADDIRKGDKDLISLFQELYEIPQDVIPKLADPIFMATYFKEDQKAAMKELGVSIDWRREFTTIDPEFSSFIVWQFHRLQKRKFILKGEHPVGWCPVHLNPVSMHDTKGDLEPEIGEFILIYFVSEDGTIFPAATLRPETVFGVTGVWVNPKETYVIAKIGDNLRWVLSKRAANKLVFQIPSIVVEQEVRGQDLIGKKVLNPITGQFVDVIAGTFVDPMTGTGVVMSVPAHAPFDYFYAKKHGSLPRVIQVITVEGYSGPLAKELVEKANPKSDDDLKRLTEEVYRQEFNKGRIRKDIQELVKPQLKEKMSSIGGMDVPNAREMITDYIVNSGIGRKIFEIMNRPVYCRCGNEVVVNLLKDQWFLDYGNPEWKSLAKELLESMRIVPDEARKDFQYTLDWLDRRACARTRGLGTPLPWDTKWIIESLSDSTIYMAYYTIIHHLRSAKISSKNLTNEFWNYVMLGEGDLKEVSKVTEIPEDLLVKMREEMDYWYPLDSRNSGKDLIPNHLSFFIFNHAAIFPRDKWPRQITVNGLLMYEGKKMSKSLRNIVPTRKAIRLYGSDTVRVVVVGGADLWSDVNFTERMARSVAEKLKRILELAKSQAKGVNRESKNIPDRWFSSKTSEVVGRVTKAVESYNFRDAINVIIYEMDDIYRKYVEWCKSYGLEPSLELVFRYIKNWGLLLAPFAPHTAEEVWNSIGEKGFISMAKWPSPKELEPLRDVEAEFIEFYLDSLSRDVRSIMEVVKGEKVTIMPSPTSRYEDVRKSLDVLEAGGNLKDYLSLVKPKGKDGVRNAQRVFETVSAIPVEFRSYIKTNVVDEFSIIKSEIEMLKKLSGINQIVVVEPSQEGLKGKSPLPLKPAIIVE